MRNKLGKFTGEGYRRWSGGIYSRYLVEQVGKPHKALVERHIHAPYSVVDKLVTYRHFFGDCLLSIVHYGGSYIEIFIKFIVQVKSEQGLSLGAECGLVLEGYTDVCAGIYDALVDNSYHTHVVVNGIVAIFSQWHASGCHHHRAARHIHSIQANL